MIYRRTHVLSLLLLVLLWGINPAPGWGQIEFNDQIRPILTRHCTSCHGPDEASREADLRLDTFGGATADLGDYAAIVPGDADASLLLERITSTDDPMPPESFGRSLNPEEIELLRRWIAEGAKYEEHWAFVKPMPPTVPEISPEKSAEYPIDAFILEQLKERGWQPNPPADESRLIRRLALDLTGLPPTRDMVDRFVAQPDQKTYESIVDQLLDSPSYGEHWASMWLDLARYADTVGYASDEDRTIWPWRDWLIEALNENKSFDEFTKEMLAGDLLPHPTEEQKLATAFHRNTLNNNEGGTNNEEFRTVAVKDRVSTTMNTWMGLTMRCAECHTHKYDPISQKEYYQFLDFFNQTADADRPNESPVLALRPLGLKSKIERLDQTIQELRAQQSQKRPVWQNADLIRAETEQGSVLEIQRDGSILAKGNNPNHEIWEVHLKLPSLEAITGMRIELMPDDYHGGRVGRGAGGAVVLTQVKCFHGDQPQTLTKAAADYAQKGFEPANLIRKEIAENNESLGWAVHHPQDGFTKNRSAIVEFEKPLSASNSHEFIVNLVFNSQWLRSNAGRIRLSFTDVEQPVDKFQRGQLDPLKTRIKQLVNQRNAKVNVPILTDLPEANRRKTHLMNRGNFQDLGEAVTAQTPESFHLFSESSPRNRLGVAEWLMDDENPLTARVTVNRLWSRLFGKGLVITEEDFGTQGTPPSHPKLLDWLAIDLQTNAWDIKRAIKQMVMSRSYQRSNKTSPAQLEADPDNIYLARGPRFRLPAETIRDQALAVSGLLSSKMYGPSVYPPNPIKRVTNAFAGTDVWQTSQGEDRYRRSLYTFLKRSQPHPLFETFDISNRDVCSLRRINTNTPLQSFMTLNDECFIEAAQALAIEMAKAKTPERQIARGLEKALVRPADPKKINTLLELYQESIEVYQKSPREATKMLGAFAEQQPLRTHQELAALVIVANVILNLDEFLTH